MRLHLEQQKNASSYPPYNYQSLIYTYHDQDAEVVSPFGLQCDYSKRAVVQNLLIFERRIYCVTVNYDLFSEAMSQIGTRAEIGFWRNEAELNYLRLLPPKTANEPSKGGSPRRESLPRFLISLLPAYV